MAPGGGDLPPTRARLACELIVRNSVRPVSPDRPRRTPRPVAAAGGRPAEASR
jgi:hypothetical protein